MSEPCIDYLLKREENIITIGTNNIKEAQNLVKTLLAHNKEKVRLEERIKLTEIDIVKEKVKLYALV